MSRRPNTKTERAASGIAPELAAALSGVKIALFDFDGTLAYTQSGNFFAYVRMFDERGITDICENEYGDHPDDACEGQIRRMAENHGMQLADDEIDLMARQFDNLYQNAQHEVLPPVFGYVRRVLDALGDDIPKIIITGNRTKNVSYALKEWRMVGAFDGLVPVGRRTSQFASKEEAYRWLLSGGSLQYTFMASDDAPVPVPANEVVVFEDSPWSLATAASLGMRTVAIMHRGNKGMPTGECDAVIDAIAESDEFCKRYQQLSESRCDNHVERELPAERSHVLRHGDCQVTIDATYGELVRAVETVLAQAVAGAVSHGMHDPEVLARGLVDKLIAEKA